MNSSKRTTAIIVVIIAIIIIGGLIWSGNKGNTTTPPVSDTTTTVPVPVSETTKVSGTLSEYQNAELGFSVKYPSTWEKEETNSGVNFIMPLDKNQVSTVATLQSIIQVNPGTCAFPPVTSIKDRGTITVGTNTVKMISMSNTVQNRVYFDRMYALQASGICYTFHLASITFTPSSKGLTGSSITQAENNNKAIVNTADTDFTNMVKSFAFVVAAQGQDETKVSPAK